MKQSLRITLTVLALIIYGCAGTTVKSNYTGQLKGDYLDVHYRIEEKDLIILVENKSPANMANLLVSVTQDTRAGGVEVQQMFKLVPADEVAVLPIPLVNDANGKVHVKCYYIITYSKSKVEYSKNKVVEEEMHFNYMM